MVLRSGRLVEEGSAPALVAAPKEDYTKELISSVLEIDESYMTNITKRIEHYWTHRAHDFNTVRLNELRDGIASKGALLYIITSVGINAVVEMAVASLVTGAAGVALRKARMI